MAAATLPLDALFTKTQQRLLGLLFAGDAEHSLSELVRRSGGGSGAIRREVERMLAARLVRERRVGNQRRFSSDPVSPFYAELRSMAGKARALPRPPATVRPSAALIARRGEVLKILAEHRLTKPRIFGSVALGTDTEASDLDLLVNAPRRASLLDLVRAKNALDDVLGVTVDLVTAEDLPQGYRAEVLALAVPL